MMHSDQVPDFTQAEILSLFRLERPLTIFIAGDTPQCRLGLNKILSTALSILQKDFLRINLEYVQSELIGNADKANLKRIHFKLSGLDITNPQAYQTAMLSFAEECRKNIDRYRAEAAREGLFIEIRYTLVGRTFIISAKNPGLPTAEELHRMKFRLFKSRSIRDTSEGFAQLEDFSEGAGLGTMSLILMLRDIGVNESAFQFIANTDTQETTARICIPLDTVTPAHAEEISESIAGEIHSIPMLSENILAVTRMLTKANIDFVQVAQSIQRDPALTGELLKFINSANFCLPQRVHSIQQAVSLVGTKGLRTMLLSIGTNHAFQRRYGKLDDLWKHAYRCASYAYHIARDLHKANLTDDAYIAGLLHDMGKIILRALHPDRVQRIDAYCAERGISGNSMEKLALGASHAKIGASIARKWNFPECILIPIEFHHQPLLAPDEWQELTGIIALANYFVQHHEGVSNPPVPDPEILDRFQLGSEALRTTLSERLFVYYAEQIKK